MSKTFIIVTVYNRDDYLQTTFSALEKSGWNGLTLLMDDSPHASVTSPWSSIDYKHIWRPNIGLSRLINLALKRYRDQGDWVIWMPDDVEVLTEGWVDIALEFAKEQDDIGLVTGKLTNFTFHGGVQRQHPKFGTWWETPYLQTPTVFSPRYMDVVKYIDLLGEDHVWGYQDVLASHRCRAMGLKIAQLECIYGHHPEHPEGNHPEMAAVWHERFLERANVISSGVFELDSDGYPVTP